MGGWAWRVYAFLVRRNTRRSRQSPALCEYNSCSICTHHVKEATKDQQHPVIGPDVFDPMLAMAITGGVNAQEHYQLGRHLYELGWLLDDAKRFQAAARQFQAAIWLSQMAKTPLPQAELGLGQALLAAEDCDRGNSGLLPVIGAQSCRSAFCHFVLSGHGTG